MKKTITESDLCKIIKETVKRVLEERDKHLLLEMPLHRKNYKERITNELPQVIINWCLVHYCTIIGRTQSKEHWKDELRGHIFGISSLSIKENDGVKKRLKVLSEIWAEDDYDKPKNLTLKVCNKFIKEQINIDSEEFVTTIQDCLNCKEGLFNVILSRDIETARNYVDSI